MRLAVITPVGPGHAELAETVCAPSVRRAMDWNMGPFSEVRHLVMDDTEGRLGRSVRRNEALQIALGEGFDWVFFLDADDPMTPNALEAFGRVIAAEPALDAVWGLTCTIRDGEEPELREDQPERLDTRAELLEHHPFLSLNIGHFVRCALAARIGFDPDMDAGEDFKFYFRLWREARCAKRPEIFFLHRRGAHSTGPRGATGQDWTQSVTLQWQQELREAEVSVPVRDAAAGIEGRMRLTNPLDTIQRAHAAGQFFEATSLAKLKRLMPRENPRIVEVGANIGNHVVWYAKALAPERIYPVEPTPEALALLEDNIALNGIGAVIDRRGMGLGVGRGEARFRAVLDEVDNLGATHLVADEAGPIRVCTLDALIGDEPVDFLKIDAEGMELDVLAGAEALIARHRPLVWVEVRRSNMMAFLQGWCRAAGYRVVESTPYVNAVDYFAIPKEQP